MGGVEQLPLIDLPQPRSRKGTADSVAVEPTKLFVSFSGGRSSGFMAQKLAREYRDKYEMVFGFANTGQESEETLVFVDRCDKEFGLGVVWLEAEVYFDDKKASGHRVVDFKTASRNGKPYEDVTKKYGIANKTFPHCTRELKLNPMKSYIKSIGWGKGEYLSAVGIRVDEPKRLKEWAYLQNSGIVYPLTNWFPITKPEINDWWENYDFDLGIEDYRGNCTWCWKKSTPKLVKIAQDTPEVYDFPKRLERDYAHAGFNTDPNYKRTFFRGGISAETILDLAKSASDLSLLNWDVDENSGCAESCEAFLIPDEETE